MKSKPHQFFATYQARLCTLAERHGIDPEKLKALVEDAYGKPDSPPAAKESELALRKLARLNVGARELNWLFQYHVLGGN